MNSDLAMKNLKVEEKMACSLVEWDSDTLAPSGPALGVSNPLGIVILQVIMYGNVLLLF